MGSGWHLHIFLLLTIWSKGAVITAVVFNDLPRTVKVDENMTAGVVASFTVNCNSSSSSGVTVTLEEISPTTSFFNSPNALGNGTFQVTLGPGATLNAREVNQYTLILNATCPGENVITSQLYIQVKEVLQCDNTFLNTAARPLEVFENVAPEAVIYTVTLKRRGNGNLTVSILFALENVSVPFTINSVGEVQAPATRFTRTQAGKLFQTNIVVSDSDGRICRSVLVVRVLPVYHNTVNFTESSKAVSVPENTGPLQTITQVRAQGEGHVLYQIISPATVYFTIDSETGVIKNTYNLDLNRNPELASTLLVVRAYNMLHPTDSATITVNITVQPRNWQGPVCQPAIYVAEIPETSRIGMSLAVLSCVDKNSNNRTLQYQMENSQIPPYSFRMERNVLQVNTTLDCDSETMINLGFQYRATILVTDSGSPQQTTKIPVLVTVSRVNEYRPECPRRFSFSVSEDAAFGEFVANVNGTDRDYPFNKIEYSLPGAGVFFIGRQSGNLYVMSPLDYEKDRSYPLTIILKDLDNDVAPQRQQTTTCNITINVQNVNDEAPVCEPGFEISTIYSTLARSTSVATLQCSDDEEGTQLSYTIVGGNINQRFHMNGSSLFHKTFSYNRDGIFDPLNYELLVEVTDSHSTPRFSTTATIIVHVIPWTTTMPTSTTTTTTAVSRKPLILHRTKEYWAPDPWFVVVLTFTGILLLSALGLLCWRFCCRKASTETSQPLLQNRGQGVEKNYIVTEDPSKDKGKVSAEVPSLQHQFDGRAQDPGQYYLYDSSSGARRWV